MVLQVPIKVTMYTDSFITKNDPSHTLIVIEENENTQASKLLTPPLSIEDLNIPVGAVIPPDLPKMFLDLLVPVQGLKNKKLPYDCSLCGDGFATWNSLIIHNKSHRHPACLACGIVVSSISKLVTHTTHCHSRNPVVVTSKYGRSRPVKSYLATLK